MPILPSGITSAIGQQTAATQARMTRLGSKVRGVRPKRAKKGTAKKVRTLKRKYRAAKKAVGRLKKGSAAAKAWGRKMRSRRYKVRGI
jgi:hypothetical protein